MCDFFSFIQDANGNIYYFNLAERKQIHKSHSVVVGSHMTSCIANADSHDSIATAFLGRKGAVNIGDKVNKYEIELGNDAPRLEVDTLNVPNSRKRHGLVDDATRWMRTFVQGKEFADICRYTLNRRKAASCTNFTRIRAAQLLSLSTGNVTKDDIAEIISVCPDMITKFHKDITSLNERLQVSLIRQNLHRKIGISKLITEDGIVKYFKSRVGVIYLDKNMVTPSMVRKIAAASGKTAYLFIRSIAHIPNMTQVMLQLLPKVSQDDLRFLQHGVNRQTARAVLMSHLKHGDLNTLIRHLGSDEAATCLNIVKSNDIRISRYKKIVLHAIAGRPLKLD